MALKRLLILLVSPICRCDGQASAHIAISAGDLAQRGSRLQAGGHGTVVAIQDAAGRNVAVKYIPANHKRAQRSEVAAVSTICSNGACHSAMFHSHPVHQKCSFAAWITPIPTSCTRTACSEAHQVASTSCRSELCVICTMQLARALGVSWARESM